MSRTFAQRYFGDRNPLGETIAIDGNDAQVTLVFDDLPENTHLKYDVLQGTNQPQFATPDDVNQRRNRLFNIGVYTYLLMRPGYDSAKWGEVSRSFFARNMTEIGNRINAQWRSWLQPLTTSICTPTCPEICRPEICITCTASWQLRCSRWSSRASTT